MRLGKALARRERLRKHPDAGRITALLTIGDRKFRNTQDWRSNEKGKKLVSP